MSSSNLEFLSILELEHSMRQAEELRKSDSIPVVKEMEGQLPLENLDLTLHLLRIADSELLRKDGMKGIMAFNSRLFDRSTAVMIFEYFKNLLEMAVESPHKVVWDLPMLTQAEQQKQLVEWNRTSAPFPKLGWLVHEFSLDQAETNRNSIALIEYGGLKRIISYAELQSMAEKVARRMQALGVKGDSTVGLLMTNDSAEAIASIYGMLTLLKLSSWSIRPLTERHTPMQVSSWREGHMCHLTQAILLLELSISWRMQRGRACCLKMRRLVQNIKML